MSVVISVRYKVISPMYAGLWEFEFRLRVEPGEALDSLRIVLLGASGAGKSSIGNAILGREAFKESSTRESEKQRGRVEDRNISIIDTPGFFNTHMTDEVLQNEMTRSMHHCYPGPHVFLLIINLETLKEDEQCNLVEKIQENFGEEALLFTMVLFIGRDKLSKTDFIKITESENVKELLDYVVQGYHVINSKDECDSFQIKMLLNRIDEMVKNNEKLCYFSEIYLRKRQLQTEVQEQKREINPEGEIKNKPTEDIERNQENVSEDGEGFNLQRNVQEAEVQENLQTQMKMEELIQEMAKERL
ncbi:GTPase IMAP family member 8-like [Puntigrus tetrazona]|uniref:GTPase IMAP family member 8-like n=1 Tax=Puntigrus tetrazona TaxID=1606681 RepID=UPI001C8925D8|nr:GTPase IMAP family member 8-like [Puntigrus tetrazona]